MRRVTVTHNHRVTTPFCMFYSVSEEKFVRRYKATKREIYHVLIIIVHPVCPLLMVALIYRYVFLVRPHFLHLSTRIRFKQYPL